MEFIVLDLDTATEDQIIEVNRANARTARLMSSEIDKLKAVAAATKRTSKKTTVVPEQIPVSNDSTTKKVDEDFEDEVDYYYSAIDKLTREDLSEKIGETLPSTKHYRYKDILYRIKAEILRNIKEIKDLIQVENMSLDDLGYFKDEILFEQEKLRLIDERLSQKQEEIVESEEQVENNIIFVPTPGGNIRVFEELDSMAQEYYEAFYELFQSIKDGTFKNVKKLHGHILTGLSEVKGFQTRVAFMRLNENSYAVVSAFVKKSDNDRGYRTTLEKKYNDYKNIESSLIANLDNEDFMALNKQYEEELFRKLSTSAKQETPVVKKKGGEQ